MRGNLLWAGITASILLVIALHFNPENNSDSLLVVLVSSFVVGSIFLLAIGYASVRWIRYRLRSKNSPIVRRS